MTKLNTAAGELRAAQLNYARAVGPALEAALTAVSNPDYMAGLTKALEGLDEGSPGRAAVAAVGASVEAHKNALKLQIEQNDRLIEQSEELA